MGKRTPGTGGSNGGAAAVAAARLRAAARALALAVPLFLAVAAQGQAELAMPAEAPMQSSAPMQSEAITTAGPAAGTEADPGLWQRFAEWAVEALGGDEGRVSLFLPGDLCLSDVFGLETGEMDMEMGGGMAAAAAPGGGQAGGGDLRSRLAWFAIAAVAGAALWLLHRGERARPVRPGRLRRRERRRVLAAAGHAARVSGRSDPARLAAVCRALTGAEPAEAELAAALRGRGRMATTPELDEYMAVRAEEARRLVLLAALMGGRTETGIARPALEFAARLALRYKLPREAVLELYRRAAGPGEVAGGADAPAPAPHAAPAVAGRAGPVPEPTPEHGPVPAAVPAAVPTTEPDAGPAAASGAGLFGAAPRPAPRRRAGLLVRGRSPVRG